MKRTIFSWIFPLLVLAVLTLPGCSAKSAATAEDFQQAAESVGYTVEEQDSGDIVSIHMATKDDSAIVFYVCNSEQEAKTALTNLRSNLPEDVDPEHVDSSYYARYTGENDESYYSLIRIGDTVLAAAVELSEKENVQSVVSELGY